MRANPFYELYLADTRPGKEFIGLFSPILLPHVQQVFLPGNIVIVGMQGAGKSMLLALLNAETRFVYLQEEAEFPIPVDFRRFISCNVNLAHSNSIDFGQRGWAENDPAEVEMLFGDFVNTLLMLDLTKTISKYVDYYPKKMRQEAGVVGTRKHLDSLAVSLASSSEFDLWLSGVHSWTSLEQTLLKRIGEYRNFLNRRKKELDSSIIESKLPFGEPIAEMVQSLKESGVILQDTNVFVDIDQYEELGNIKTPFRGTSSVDYRSVVNRGLARRDGRVSYRVGARPHSWRRHSAIMGSSGKLEEERDYKYVDLDILLKQQEDRRTYIFPKFAEDVFERRLRVAGLERPKSDTTELVAVYGASLTGAQKATFYNPSGTAKPLSFEREWRQTTIDRLTELAKKDILSARLGEAWVRQKGDVDDLSVRDGLLPWEAHPWWKKERVEVALLQIVSSNQQRPLYSGSREIIDISNGNILTFISINQHIWDQYFRYETRENARPNKIPEIGRDLQSIGILKASEHWFNKLNEETGRSSERVAFVREIARVLRAQLLADRKLSYPGASGFSIRQDHLDQMPPLRNFLEELSDYGNLTMLGHTTKDKNRAARTKFYISPILCPHLRLPFDRVKEPKYTNIKEIYEWLADAKVDIGMRSNTPGSARSRISMQPRFL